MAPSDLARVASVGLRTRKLRAALSSLGIAIGVAAIVAVLGLSSSSQAGLLAEIGHLGTNLLTVSNGRTFFGKTAELPTTAPGMISRIGPVTDVQSTGSVTGSVYRSPLVPSIDTNAIAIEAASVGLPAAERFLGFDGHPSTIYVRAATDEVGAVQAVLERRSEIGLRRALGATRGRIRTQFLAEAVLLALVGGAVGVGAGVAATAVYASVKGWAVSVPVVAWTGGMGAALVIGAAAGLLPALRAARMSPTEALRTA